MGESIDQKTADPNSEQDEEWRQAIIQRYVLTSYSYSVSHEMGAVRAHGNGNCGRDQAVSTTDQKPRIAS